MDTERVALITGAGAGVGRATALRFALDARAGTIVVNDIDDAKAKAVAGEVEAAGARGLGLAADVTSWDAVQEMVQRVVAEAGGVDVLVNNAGMPVGVDTMTRFSETEPSQWAPWIDINLYGVMYCTRAVLPSMLERGWGRIVTVISDAARVGDVGLAAYAAAKAGAAGFTRSIAREVGAAGITANSVALGSIKHGVMADSLDDAVEQKMLKRYVVKRLGRAEDPAALIAFLASDDAEWITGQTYPVNGGYSMSI